MENTDTKIKNGLGEKLQVAILILLIVAICSFIIAIIVLVKNVDEIKQNPIDYGIDKYGFDSCTCFNGEFLFMDFYGSNLEEEVMENWTS